MQYDNSRDAAVQLRLGSLFDLVDRFCRKTSPTVPSLNRYTCTVGHKPASQSDCNARDAAVAASLALQFGCPLEVLRHALLRDSQGRPSTPLGAAVDAIAERGNT